jgi:hypothetical protein
MNRSIRNSNRLSFSMSCLLTAFLVGCGGGGGDSKNSPGSAVLSSGVMTKGSVILNGVHFDDSTATIACSGETKTPAFLQTGMVVEVKGLRNKDGFTGTAQQVNVLTEVRGVVQSINNSTPPFSFVAIGQTVLLDDSTVFEPGAASPLDALNSVVLGETRVEAFGLRDAAGAIHATLARLVTDATIQDEVRGTASNVSMGESFSLQPGNVSIDISGASVLPQGATVAEGTSVQVLGTFDQDTETFFASQVIVEDVQNVAFHPHKGRHHGKGKHGKNHDKKDHHEEDENELEGFVTECTDSPCSNGVFFVNGQAVELSDNTRFEDGGFGDLAEGSRVEIEGNSFDGDVLVAGKIEFK